MTTKIEGYSAIQAVVDDLLYVFLFLKVRLVEVDNQLRRTALLHLLHFLTQNTVPSQLVDLDKIEVETLMTVGSEVEKILLHMLICRRVQ